MQPRTKFTILINIMKLEKLWFFVIHILSFSYKYTIYFELKINKRKI